jgi:hypothetical protein
MGHIDQQYQNHPGRIRHPLIILKPGWKQHDYTQTGKGRQQDKKDIHDWFADPGLL